MWPQGLWRRRGKGQQLMTTERGFLSGEGTVLDSPIADRDAFIYELVELVSSTKGVDPLELPTLFDAIDPEAVQRTLQSGAAGTTKVSFHYAGCEVVVTSDRELFVLERESPDV